ncbi:thioredoxin-2-like [Zootermopsis nevadensis]|uniref:Thioredoxin n=1 Tax=Zootermopsis nevadensis TaxID=136037 RepID=A0A067QZQ7_ZOONE|nr:thioredoxin-2-like [Zootermopsis nevadensis]KDR16041.1 Thioredoxin-2 [Zootermopsis nevadensis]
MAIHIKDWKEFDTKIKEAGDALVVIDFFAKWCGPCKVIGPKIEELATENPGVVFLKVDVDECEDLASHYEISAMPTFVFVKNQEKLDAFSGANADTLKEYITKYK